MTMPTSSGVAAESPGPGPGPGPGSTTPGPAERVAEAVTASSSLVGDPFSLVPSDGPGTAQPHHASLRKVMPRAEIASADFGGQGQGKAEGVRT